MLGGLLGWLVFSAFLVWKGEFIGAAVLSFFFFSQAIIDYALGGRVIPNGQLVLIFFGPLLLISVAVRQRAPVGIKNLSPFVLYGVLIVIAIVWNGLSFWDYKSQLTPVLFAALIYLSIDGERELRLLVTVFAVLVMINTFVAAMQYSGHVHWYLPSQLRAGDVDAGGFRRGFGLANHFSQAGLYCAAMVPIAALQVVANSQRWRKVFWIAAAGGAILGLVFTGLRAGFLGGLLGLVLALRWWDAKRAKVYLAGGAALVLMVMAAVPLLHRASDSYVHHLTHIDQSAESRPHLAELAIAQWKLSPVFGAGPRSVARSEGGAGDPHNTYADVLADYGVLGLVTFLGMLWFAHKRVRAAIEYGPRDRALLIGVNGALISACVVAFFHSVDYIEVFWLFPALALATDRTRMRQRRGRDARRLRMQVTDGGTARLPVPARTGRTMLQQRNEMRGLRNGRNEVANSSHGGQTP